MKKLMLLIIAAVFFVAQEPVRSKSDQQLWAEFKSTYGKTYKDLEEEQLRQNIFIENKNLIQEHNKLYGIGKTSFTMKINQFADLTNAEFRKLNGFMNVQRDPTVPEYKAPNDNEVPKSFEWRPTGAVTVVKNQGQCGSGWAFATTGALEGQTFLKNRKFLSLSEQNLLDCSYPQGNRACEGGSMISAYEYIKQNGGIDSEESYPYIAKDSLTCKFDKKNVRATMKGYTNIREGSESDLKAAVAEVGPIAVAIDAGHISFQFLSLGIYYESSCNPHSLNHGVLVVGYGNWNDEDYWLLKNSWGTTWGENGYFLMARNKDNNCGIASMATYPNV